LRHEDAVHKVDDDQLLVVMKATNSTEAARFVNRLRTQGGSDLLTVVSTNKDQEALSLYHTAVVSAPEDGDSVNVLFDRAHLAFNVNKRVGVKSSPV
jgi:NAD(P)H-hydrate repair Nnr-like enzyme with NAD(P)H-hydrate dehydratase domain